MSRAVTYRRAGVDVAGAEAWLAAMRPLIRSTRLPGVLPDRGQFAGLFRLGINGWRDPVLVASADGVGTKAQLARTARDYAALGEDLVAMNANDVVTCGARPLFFLDYLAVGRLSTRIMSPLLRGIVRGCRLSGCALLGGETAEMPGVYGPSEFDVAGFCVGVIERRRLLDGSAVQAGDVVVGLASAGVHANGFSLVRQALPTAARTGLHRALMRPTRNYVQVALALARRVPVHAFSHVTGGGLARRLPSLVAGRATLSVRWHRGSWPMPAVFRAIQRLGRIAPSEMERTFNMGIGFALACRPRDAAAVVRLSRRHRIGAWVIGTIEQRGR